MKIRNAIEIQNPMHETRCFPRGGPYPPQHGSAMGGDPSCVVRQ